MSWDAYVSNNLMCVVDKEGNTLTSAALVGLDTTPDTSPVWAQSAQFPAITAEEVRMLAHSSVGSWAAGGAAISKRLTPSARERRSGRPSGAPAHTGVAESAAAYARE